MYMCMHAHLAADSKRPEGPCRRADSPSLQELVHEVVVERGLGLRGSEVEDMLELGKQGGPQDLMTPPGGEGRGGEGSTGSTITVA